MYLLFFLNQTQRECCRMGRALDWECGLDLTESPFFLFLKILFLERGREGNINVWLTLARPPTGDVAYNPGMCADWESNQPPFGLQTSIQSTEPHQPGVVQTFLVKHQIMQVTQPYYNPDWAPCDFWLFPKLNHL